MYCSYTGTEGAGEVQVRGGIRLPSRSHCQDATADDEDHKGTSAGDVFDGGWVWNPFTDMFFFCCEWPQHRVPATDGEGLKISLQVHPKCLHSLPSSTTHVVLALPSGSGGDSPGNAVTDSVAAEGLVPAPPQLSDAYCMPLDQYLNPLDHVRTHRVKHRCLLCKDRVDEGDEIYSEDD